MILEHLAIKSVELGIDLVYTHKTKLRTIVATKTTQRNNQIRVSIASLLRVRRGEKFLLIESRRRRGLYGPVGGVVNYFPGAHAELDRIGFVPQGLSGSAARDLRGFVKGTRLSALLSWYFAGRHVEKLTVAREIEEELREVGLPLVCPSRLEFNLVRRVHEGPAKVSGHSYLQYRMFDIYELETGHLASRAFGRNLVKSVSASPTFLWASKDEIRKGSVRGHLVGDHSGYLFGDSRVGTEPPSF